MPGLLRGMARTAVVAGTATAVSNRVSRRQGQRWAQQGYEQQQRYAQPEPQYVQQAPPPQPAPAAPAASNADRIAELKQLADLHAQGVLTDAEFATEKQRILAS
ncbi:MULTISPECIES: SHOCT domain-containing protein [unclassified Gordonia (in: high G+C Gram-positive bacteria)]|uniref:SHOCT domain-containing protein n=1 Tax=Gordonia sp. VNQ95 TaxID=3156619 RepID=UPI0032B4D55F